MIFTFTVNGFSFIAIDCLWKWRFHYFCFHGKLVHLITFSETFFTHIFTKIVLIICRVVQTKWLFFRLHIFSFQFHEFFPLSIQWVNFDVIYKAEFTLVTLQIQCHTFMTYSRAQDLFYKLFLFSKITNK